MQNHILCNIRNGQIITKTIAAKTIPDDLIRDGWVVIHRDEPPEICIVIEEGKIRDIYTSSPSLDIDVQDLDLASNPEQLKQKIALQVRGLFKYHKP